MPRNYRINDKTNQNKRIRQDTRYKINMQNQSVMNNNKIKWKKTLIHYNK